MTPRQTEVAMLLPTGATNKEIAQRMGITVDTVASHLATLSQIWKAKNRTDLAVKIDRIYGRTPP